MTEDKKQHNIATAVTLIVHVALITLLYLTSLKTDPKAQQDNEGIPVLLGDVTEAGGMEMNGFPQPSDGTDQAGQTGTDNSDIPVADENIPASTKEKSDTPPKDRTPQKAKDEKDRIVQKDEKSIAAEKARKAEKIKAEQEAEAKRKAAEAEAAEARRKAAEEAAEKRRLAEEAAAKKRAEEKARAAAAAAVAANKMAGAFGKKDGKQGNSGYGNGNGSQGSPQGNANVGAVSGKGGIGTSAVVGDRTAVYLQKPSYDDLTAEGTIVVSIIVNSNGGVVSAIISNSTTTSPALRASALKAAQKSKFSSGSNNAESGRITYRFKLN